MPGLAKPGCHARFSASDAVALDHRPAWAVPGGAMAVVAFSGGRNCTPVHWPEAAGTARTRANMAKGYAGRKGIAADAAARLVMFHR